MRDEVTGDIQHSNDDYRKHQREDRPLLVAVSWAIFALVLAVVIIGVLYIARDFIAHHTGWAFLGATPK
ncbi:transmembrane protein [Mycobacterium tuberculosis]|nr:transmembrane protein [Mycobacterium tuberculosis]